MMAAAYLLAGSMPDNLGVSLAVGIWAGWWADGGDVVVAKRAKVMVKLGSKLKSLGETVSGGVDGGGTVSWWLELVSLRWD
jgi:hypothetical protein